MGQTKSGPNSKWDNREVEQAGSGANLNFMEVRKSAYYDTAYKRHKNYVNSLIKSTKAEYFKTKLGNTKNSYDS
jgi:hypothetical protein